jgi:hypothetical protein
MLRCLGKSILGLIFYILNDGLLIAMIIWDDRFLKMLRKKFVEAIWSECHHVPPKSNNLAIFTTGQKKNQFSEHFQKLVNLYDHGRYETIVKNLKYESNYAYTLRDEHKQYYRQKTGFFIEFFNLILFLKELQL